MGQESSLWARNHPYGPGVISLGQESSLWARNHLYGPGIISMGQESSLWARSHLYGPGIISMGQESSLWDSSHLYGPGIISMGLESSLLIGLESPLLSFVHKYAWFIVGHVSSKNVICTAYNTAGLVASPWGQLQGNAEEFIKHHLAVAIYSPPSFAIPCSSTGLHCFGCNGNVYRKKKKYWNTHCWAKFKVSLAITDFIQKQGITTEYDCWWISMHTQYYVATVAIIEWQWGVTAVSSNNFQVQHRGSRDWGWYLLARLVVLSDPSSHLGHSHKLALCHQRGAGRCHHTLCVCVRARCVCVCQCMSVCFMWSCVLCECNGVCVCECQCV